MGFYWNYFGNGIQSPCHVALCCSVAQLCLTLYSPMDCSTPGFPVLHHLLEFAQSHVYQVGDAIHPSHPLLSHSPPAFSLFQHQGIFLSLFFASGGQSIGVSASASVLAINIQGWFPLRLTGWIFLKSKGLSSFLQHHNSKASTHILLVCKEILSFWRETFEFLYKALKWVFPVWLSISTVKNLF